MTNKEVENKITNIKSLLKLGQRIAKVSWIVWAVETIVFLCIKGLHEAGTVEQILDHIVIIGMFIGVYLIIASNSRMTELMVFIMERDIQRAKSGHNLYGY